LLSLPMTQIYSNTILKSSKQVIHQTALIDKVMGELHHLHPVNTPFNKKDC
jgi:hypothetical protein